ncbi:MAG: hypothetical protein ACYC35_11105 [Pirellulales bacterium]
MSRIASDLGVPCQHKLSEGQMQRYRGLFWYVHPSFEGTFSIYAGEEWYDERAESIVQSMARSRPQLPREFYRKVLLEHDWAYWHTIRGQVLEFTGQGKQEKDRDSGTVRPTRGAERVEG